MSVKQTLVVIGNGMVGQHFLAGLAESTIKEQYQIITFCEEPRAAYDRVHLSSFFTGTTAEELSLVEDGFFDRHGIILHLGDKAASIDRTAKTVTSAKGLTIAYDKLVLATGSYPFVPPVPGHDRAQCLVYRTIEDLEAIAAAAKTGTVGTVVGGGLLGLEAAKALMDLGLETHVVEFAPRLMAVQLDDAGGAMLRRKIENLGVIVHTGKNTSVITDGERCVNKMCFADGEELETDIVLFSAGIRPRDELARASGLEVGQRGGIVIDNQCRTSDPSIYAIGECALWNGMIYGLVAPGYTMARTVVADLAGDSLSFTGADMSTKLKLMGVDVASIGDAHAKTQGAMVYTYQNGASEVYKRLVVSQDKKQLLGAVLVGDASGYGTLLQYCLNGIELPENPDALILPHRSDESVGLGPDALPASAQICSCYDVTKGAICSAIEGGCMTMGALKAETKAATGCGGCSALLKSVLDSELSKQGFEVNTDICEHFAYTRQDLHNLIRVEQIKTFADLLHKHGKGQGCEICKPTVGNILASQWNEHILEKPHLGLQDTNDTFLANMQKDGTYSVVPRITGGEISPDMLIALGQVGKKYKLYTKITGGQRVDLFGARVDQLPHIWKELIDAGFESGHAYGKSLRTVKSCVGSTWCRYGVDDSVGLAIELENRYKGLRSPHKIKFAVSGCTRECAEAQGKDVGVIATENGWNLYVCGNGGMKPRHADLFATGLDKPTLIKYIDRFLSFYVRTADRLQRTSVWMENMEGGLDYLKSVVIEDKLGLCDQLEQQMQYVIDTYQCEWKSAIADEAKLKRFRHFINSDRPDDNVVFVEERGQIRPASDNERKHFKLMEMA
ncbi:assimilatory nitrite reductase (NAD(P)H) large subunit precursor [Methylobacter tundripaludum]|uniref:Assimilatory nitrite reductase (NAD(P)H) large subunit n=1 Tax=Methylobacter tundripaludum TaxID=173365 RepID=A0A2S6H2S9_9GAMM|nr:nitrite reductase large subunit NirB [Methylobacter tundripaludum]PPK71730.1 assimilatory nitrite reductase (NAD(P)H) large subunit precursor [Methylobacter tundripaludum]